MNTPTTPNPKTWLRNFIGHSLSTTVGKAISSAWQRASHRMPTEGALGKPNGSDAA
jgi:hypothetical protein